MRPDEYSRMREVEDEYWWYHGLRRLAVRMFVRHLNVNEKIRVLDAGCGTGGGLCSLATSLSRSVCFGVELESLAIRYCRERGITRLCQASVHTLPFKDSSFDAVISTDVIYMQGVDDLRALQEFHRVLSNQGVLFINVPAFEWLRGDHDLAVDTRHRYTKRELRTLIYKSGFRVLKISYWNVFFLPAVFVVRRLRSWWRRGTAPTSDLRPLPRLINSILKCLLAIEIALVGQISLPFGTSVFCVGTKQ